MELYYNVLYHLQNFPTYRSRQSKFVCCINDIREQREAIVIKKCYERGFIYNISEKF